MKYGDLTLGQIEAGINKIGGKDVFMQIVRGDSHFAVSESKCIVWTTDGEGNIHLTLISKGGVGEWWEGYFQGRRVEISDDAYHTLMACVSEGNVLDSYRIIVRPGGKIAGNDRVTRKIRTHGADKGWREPHWEVACLLCDALSDKDLQKMGLSRIVIMHEPVIHDSTDPSLFSFCRYSDDSPRLTTFDSAPDQTWDNETGFAFVVPEAGD